MNTRTIFFKSTHFRVGTFFIDRLVPNQCEGPGDGADRRRGRMKGGGGEEKHRASQSAPSE